MVDAQLAPIFVVSDGRGQTIRTVLRAALVQFAGYEPRIQGEADVLTAERVRDIVEAAAEAKAVIYYTLVAEDTRYAMKQMAARLGVPAVDVLGPVLSALHHQLQRAPEAKPGLFYASERAEFDRHSAIDYTLEHDDGRRPHELDKAHVVLTGVSRAAKSSTCFYLAYHGIKAANVPLVPGIPPPPELVALDPRKVVGLWVNPSRLLVVRTARAANLKLGSEVDYVDRDAVKTELRDARRLMDQRGWRMIDASYLAIEEVAREVMRLCELDEQNLG